jgi:hypothetical protein
MDLVADAYIARSWRQHFDEILYLRLSRTNTNIQICIWSAVQTPSQINNQFWFCGNVSLACVRSITVGNAKLLKHMIFSSDGLCCASVKFLIPIFARFPRKFPNPLRLWRPSCEISLAPQRCLRSLHLCGTFLRISP